MTSPRESPRLAGQQIVTHAFNQMTTPASGSTLFGTVLTSELANVSSARTNLVRQTAPVAVLATLRGSSFKELAAVRQGGVAYDVMGTELAKPHWPRLVA